MARKTTRQEKSEKRRIAETSEILRLAIKNSGLSNRAFAKKAKISERRLYTYTSGETPLYKAAAEIVLDIAQALKLDPGFLTGHRDIEEYYDLMDSIELDKEIKEKASEQAKARRRRGLETESEKIDRKLIEVVERVNKKLDEEEQTKIESEE